MYKLQKVNLASDWADKWIKEVMQCIILIIREFVQLINKLCPSNFYFKISFLKKALLITKKKKNPVIFFKMLVNIKHHSASCLIKF